MKKLAGKVALVTGGSRSIGAGTLRQAGGSGGGGRFSRQP
jgi:NAD(P)-dependent dehydrogenase (short-subunit alcohol dehydrogenase family)